MRRVLDPELQELLNNDVSTFWRRLWNHYVMGAGSERMYTEQELKTKLDWQDTGEEEINDRRLRVLNLELSSTGENLRDQFNKTGMLIALLGFIIGFGLSGRGFTNHLSIRAVCVAAAFAVLVLMPRFKVFFHFRTRGDAGLRAGRIKTQWDEYWYTYQWLVRREITTNTNEGLVIIAAVLTFVALIIVGLTA